MELRELIATFRRWAWLLIIGLSVGLLGGYFASNFMKPIYEASTKLMISRAIQEDTPEFTGLNSQQLVQTYVQMLKAKPLLDTTSENVGVKVDSEQLSVQQILDTQIIEIKVEDHNPEVAADIANSMVLVLMEKNDQMQAGQYSSLEASLTKQSDIVQEQIGVLQAEYDQAIETDYQEQLSLVKDQLASTKAELITLQTEMATLRPEWRPEDKILMAEKQARVQQLQIVLSIYEQIHANLLILESPFQYRTTELSPYLQQLQSTIDSYQRMHLTMVENLEQLQLERLQRTPFIVQIEEATIPEKPVRPIPILYTALSGVVGLMLAVLVVLFFEALRDDQGISEAVPHTGDQWQLEPPDVDGDGKPVAAKRKKVIPARKALLQKGK